MIIILKDVPLPALILILCTVTVIVQIIVETIYAQRKKRKKMHKMRTDEDAE